MDNIADNPYGNDDEMTRATMMMMLLKSIGMTKTILVFSL